MNKEKKEIKHYRKVDEEYEGIGKPPEIDVFETSINIKTLGSLIKTLRMHKNLTQEQVGKKMGSKRAEVSKIERGYRNLTINRLDEVFKALSVKVKVKVIIEVNDNKIV